LLLAIAITMADWRLVERRVRAGDLWSGRALI